MADWQVTARTLYCDSVADEITLLINNDGKIDCTGLQRYGAGTVESSRFRREHGKTVGCVINCPGTSCQILNDYAAAILAGGKQ